MASQQENQPTAQQEATAAAGGDDNGDKDNGQDRRGGRRGQRCTFCGLRGHAKVDCFLHNYLAFSNHLSVALSRRSQGGGIQQNDYETLDEIHRRLEQQLPNTADMREILEFSREYLNSLLEPT